MKYKIDAHFNYKTSLQNKINYFSQLKFKVKDKRRKTL